MEDGEEPKRDTESVIESDSEASFDEDEDRRSQISRFLGYEPTAPPPDFRSISATIDNRNDWKPSRRNPPKKYPEDKLEWNAEAKVQSRNENARRKSHGEALDTPRVFSQKPHWNAQSKVDATNSKYRSHSESSIRTNVVFSDRRHWKASPKVDTRNPLYDHQGRKQPPEDEQWPTTPERENVPDSYTIARYEEMDEVERQEYLGDERESSGYQSILEEKPQLSFNDSIEEREDLVCLDDSPIGSRKSSATSRQSSDVEEPMNHTMSLTETDFRSHPVLTLQPSRPSSSAISLHSSPLSEQLSLRSSPTISTGDPPTQHGETREAASESDDDLCCLCPCFCCWTMRCNSRRKKATKGGHNRVGTE